MKLVKFSVTNFRSILEAQNIPISDATVLVGKNNEGKSNLLKALSIAMNIIRYYPHTQTRMRQTLGRGHHNRFYEWSRDFPISKAEKKGDQKTVLKVEFELDEQEVAEFKQEIRSSLNGTLPLKIEIMRDNSYKVEVVKGGKGSKTLNSKANKITRYIAQRISFNYIPAVRTHKETLKVIDELLAYELSTLEDDSDYKKALKTIDDFRKPILDNLSKKIKEPLSEFLPNIKDVKIIIAERSVGIGYRRDFDVEIDDGTLTSIEQKGDGVQSLAALGLLKNKSRRTGASIIAIEEPESHLHSGAIHQLQEIIESLESDNQIVLTTHNPLFVNRNSISSNIIVDKGKAKQAKDIKTIRDILGVQVSDNLTNARFSLIVEGTSDEKSLRAILPKLSPKIGFALKSNNLIIEPVGGSGNLPYKLSNLKSQVCLYHVLLDHDDGANKERDKAEEKELLIAKNLTQTICRGMSESEFEDCINPDIYKKEIFEQHGVDLNAKEFKTSSKKWSDRVSDCFSNHGKSFNDKRKQAVKNTVVSCVLENPSKALCEHKGNSIKALVTALETLLEGE